MKRHNRALNDAVLMDDVASVSALLNEGADANARDQEHQETALMLAKSGIVARILLDNGADVNAKDERGWTALIHAALARPHKTNPVLPVLLKSAADVNAANSEGETALIKAVQSADADKVRILLENGADVTAKDDAGYTALKAATNYGLLAIGELLRSAGASE